MTFRADLHLSYLLGLGKTGNDLSKEHHKISGVYWCLGSLKILNKQHGDSLKQDMITFVQCCQHLCGGFGGNIGHDPHITQTLYALLILSFFDSVDKVDLNRLAQYVSSLQNTDGSFRGDYSGEVDTRFSYCAVSTLSLLGRLDLIDTVKARDFILRCSNSDGGFGGMPGAESHAAYVFTSIGTLKILSDLNSVDVSKLGLWLTQR
jgi:geranylgeranyl transferase type-2 subunit beta